MEIWGINEQIYFQNDNFIYNISILFEIPAFWSGVTLGQRIYPLILLDNLARPLFKNHANHATKTKAKF